MANRIVLNTVSYHGKGAIGNIVPELTARGFQKAFVCSDPDLIRFNVTKKVTDLLDAAGFAYEVYSDIKPNPTIENVQTGVAAFRKSGADCIVAIGGGSSMDTAKAIVATPYGDVLPSSKALAGGGVEMIELADRQFLLRNALNGVRENYDYIFIDCPPSLELLTLNALCAADSLLVPLQGEYYALEGLSDLMNTVRIVRRNMNPRLQIEGVLLTMFDGRTNLAIQVAQEVKRYFPGKVYATVIPRNIRLSEAPSHGKPITAYDRTCRGAEAYLSLANEFLKKNV